jgi:hypothetical protein
MMRRILVDTRGKIAKRSGGWAHATLVDAVARTDPPMSILSIWTRR